MLNKLKEVVQTTMDALAPPPPLLDDFIYHWRRFMKYYLNPDHENQAAAELTNLPICLQRLREILIDEDCELEEKKCTVEVGPCMEYLLKFNLLDLLVTLAISDEPPGMKQYILKFFSKTLTQLKKPNVAHSSMYVPLVRLMNVCDGLLHSVSEKEEVEFLLHLSAVLRKQPALSLLFFSDESIKNLTEVTNSGDYIKYTNILDLALSYVDSADSEIRVKTCQCIILLCSMPDDVIAQCIVKNFKLNHFLIGRLITLFYEIPPNDYIHFENIEASWALDVCPETQSESIRNRQAVVFFNWLDFINQLVMESHTLIKTSIRHSVGEIFLEDAFKMSNLSHPETMAILHKYYSCITAPELLGGFHKWLIVEGNEPDVPGISTNSLLKALIDNCSSENSLVAVFSLKFFVEVLNKCDGSLLQCLILCYLKDRCYYDTSAVPASWSDEEDERQKYSSSPEALSSSRTLAPSNVDKIIQSFSNITPIQLRSQNTEENIEQLKKHYEQVIKRCAEYHWPTEAVSDVESLSNDSNPEVDTHFRRFYEGPFLRMIFTKIKYIHTLNYCQMLQVSAIVSKLALLPHPFLHEYLLNPFLPLRNGIQSLFSSLKFATSDVSSRVHIILNFQQELNNTRERLLNESKFANSKGEIDRYLEACVVLEELCNQLAAIIYVKYAYFHLSSS